MCVAMLASVHLGLPSSCKYTLPKTRQIQKQENCQEMYVTVYEYMSSSKGVSEGMVAAEEQNALVYIIFVFHQYF